MMANSTLYIILSSWLTQIPYLIALAICAAVCVMNIQKDRRASLYAIIGIVILLGVATFAPVIHALITGPIMQNSGANQLGWALTVLNLFWNLLRGVGAILLTIAVFTGRTATSDVAVGPTLRGTADRFSGSGFTS